MAHIEKVSIIWILKAGISKNRNSKKEVVESVDVWIACTSLFFINCCMNNDLTNMLLFVE